MKLSTKVISVWKIAKNCNCKITQQHNGISHKLCGICKKTMFYGSHESVEQQNNSKGAWNIDHKTPLSKSGSNKIENMQAVHIRCNIYKADK